METSEASVVLLRWTDGRVMDEKLETTVPVKDKVNAKKGRMLMFEHVEEAAMYRRSGWACEECKRWILHVIYVNQGKCLD